MEAYLFKIEIGNHIGVGKHYNIVANSLEDAWQILFRMAVPVHAPMDMWSWHVTYLGSGKLITNDSV
jgi:hypothetical protein